MALRFTRFCNPHVGLQETQIVLTLGNDDDADGYQGQQLRAEAIRRFNEYIEGNISLEEHPRKRLKGESKTTVEHPERM